MAADAASAPPGSERPGATDQSEAAAESWEGVAPEAARRLLVAAVEAFAERGFHATTTRDIAGRAGMSPAALYIHYKTKEELLFQISCVGHERSLRLLSKAAETEGDVATRLAAAISAFVRWHAEQRTTARVVQYELSSLSEEHYAQIVALRRRTEGVVRELIEEGVTAGEFSVLDAGATALAMLSLCVDVARWYNPAGRRTPRDIGAFYADLALRMVLARRAWGQS